MEMNERNIKTPELNKADAVPGGTVVDSGASPASAAGEKKSVREVLYRKYRFTSFADMCGQEQVSSFFKNAIKYNKISHAYLFAGPRGTGKTSMARLFAKILNCTDRTSYEPCGKCANCLDFEKGAAADIIEKDAASNRGIDEIRGICEDANFMPVSGRFKIFILDEAHMLTIQAANAFLKTLEEPPQHVIFILATTELHKLPATILSRCQLVHFSRIQVYDILKRLEFVITEENKTRNENEKINYEKNALLLLAKKAQGGMRDALSLLEYVIALCQGAAITAEAVENLLGIHSVKMLRDFIKSVIDKKTDIGLKIIKKVYSGGNEILAFLEALNSYLITLTFVKLGINEAELLEYDDDDLADMKEIAAATDEKYIYKLSEMFSECLSAIRYAPDQLSHLEFVYIKSTLSKKDAQPAAIEKSAVPDVQPVFDSARIEAMINERLAVFQQNMRQAPPQPGARTAPGFAGSVPNGNLSQVSQPAAKLSGKVTFDKIKMGWHTTYLQQIKQMSIPTHALISAGNPVKLNGHELEIDFTKNSFCGERLASSSHLKISEDIFAEVFGEKIPFKILLPSQNKTEQAEQRKKEILEEKKNDPMVKKILEEFEGEIIGVEEQ